MCKKARNKSLSYVVSPKFVIVNITGHKMGEILTEILTSQPRLIGQPQFMKIILAKFLEKIAVKSKRKIMV